MKMSFTGSHNTHKNESFSVHLKRGELSRLLNEYIDPLDMLDKKTLEDLKRFFEKHKDNILATSVTPPKRLLSAALGIMAQSGFSPQAQAEYQQYIQSSPPAKLASILPLGIGQALAQQAGLGSAAIYLDPRSISKST